MNRLKKHLNEPYLFESQIVQSYSECNFAVKFWTPLVEKVFRNTSIIPHWGDTIPGSLNALSISIKMNLRLVAVLPKKRLSDHGYGEFSRFVSEPKFFKDKRKAVIASKALLTSIISKEPTIDFRGIYIPYVIVMGVELYWCSLSFAREKTYVTRKLKNVSFPSSINCLPQEIQVLTNGLLCLLDMSLIVVKRLATQGTKRKSMDIFMASSSTKSKNDCLTEVLWDKIDADDMEDELSDGDDGEDEIDEDDIQEKIDGNNEE